MTSETVNVWMLLYIIIKMPTTRLVQEVQ